MNNTVIDTLWKVGASIVLICPECRTQHPVTANDPRGTAITCKECENRLVISRNVEVEKT